MQYADDNEKLTNEIISFREEVLNPPTKKSAKSIPFENAIVLMEASFNYHHGKSNKNYSQVTYDTVMLPIEFCTNDMLTIDAVRNLYVELNNEIYYKLEACDFDNIVIKFVDLSIGKNENGNVLLAFVAIANDNVLKAGGSVLNSLWVGATPFTNMYKTWEVANGHNHKRYAQDYSDETVDEYFSDTEVAIELTGAIRNLLPYENSSVYIYLVNKDRFDPMPLAENSQVFPVYCEAIYEANTAIAEPDQYSVHPNAFFFQHYGRFSTSEMEWYYLPYNDKKSATDINYRDPSTTYRFMNKYVNLSLVLAKDRAPYGKKAIDVVFKTHIRESPASPQFKRSLSGVIDIYYAQSVPDPYHNLMSLTLLN